MSKRGFEALMAKANVLTETVLVQGLYFALEDS